MHESGLPGSIVLYNNRWPTCAQDLIQLKDYLIHLQSQPQTALKRLNLNNIVEKDTLKFLGTV